MGGLASSGEKIGIVESGRKKKREPLERTYRSSSEGWGDYNPSGRGGGLDSGGERNVNRREDAAKVRVIGWGMGGTWVVTGEACLLDVKEKKEERNTLPSDEDS